MLTLAKHPTTTAPKKSNLHSLKQTQNTFMFLASLVQCMHLRRFKNNNSICRNYHLFALSCHSSVHMAHSKSSSNLSPSLFFHSLCIRSSLHSTPCRPHRPFPGPLAFAVHSIHGGARGEEPLHDGSLANGGRQVQRCPTSGAEGLGDVNGWRAPPRGSPPPTPTAVGETAICGVKFREFHLFQHCVASWLNDSHYRCWCL